MSKNNQHHVSIPAVIGAFLVAGAIGNIVHAHGPQIQVDVVDNTIVTRGVASDTAAYTVLQPLTRVYSVDMTSVLGAWVGDYNADDHTGPGFVILQNRFAETTQLRFNIVNELRLWNGSSFVDTTPEELQLSRSSGTVFTNTGNANPISGFDIITSVANATVGQHREVRYTLLGDGSSPLTLSDDGVYLLTLELKNLTSGGAATSIGNSLPFYMLFNKNAAGGDKSASLAYVNAVLVPEPSMMMLTLSASLFLLRKKPSRTR